MGMARNELNTNADSRGLTRRCWTRMNSLAMGKREEGSRNRAELCTAHKENGLMESNQAEQLCENKQGEGRAEQACQAGQESDIDGQLIQARRVGDRAEQLCENKQGGGRAEQVCQAGQGSGGASQLVTRFKIVTELNNMAK